MFFPTEKKIKKIYVVPAPPNQLAPQKLMTALASGEKKTVICILFFISTNSLQPINLHEMKKYKHW